MKLDHFIAERYSDLISLLVLWHRLESTPPVSGYPPECPSCAGYLTSRQYDDQNGAFETSERGQKARELGHMVEAMEEPHRTAIRFLARNRATGAAVWVSPRLPADESARMQLVADALAELVDRL